MPLATALAHLRAGRAPEAAALIRSHLASHQADPEAWFLLAIAEEDCGRLDAAVACYDRALAERPEFPDALHNRGLVLSRLGRYEDAESTFRRCIGTDAASARTWRALTDVLLASAKYEAAVESATSLLRLGDATAPIRLGLALASLGRLAEARETIRAARHSAEASAFVARMAGTADPEVILSPENIFLTRQFSALGRCDWSDWDEYVAQMRTAAESPDVLLEPAVAFMTQHLPLSGVERHGIARRIAERIEAKVSVMAPPGQRTGNRIRIGILSPDFREHLNAYLLLPLFEVANRERFEVYAYSLAADDRSAARARVKAAADHFRDLHGLADAEAALAIRSDGVDILVDAGGHTAGGRFEIVAQRPGRLQVLYLGFSGSMASRRVDYAIVDPIVAPDEAEWSETLAYVPHPWFLYDFRAAPPDTALSRRDYGLPDDAFVYCAFHRPEKISPDVFNLWMRILARVPGSVLWFLDLAEIARRNLASQASKHGIDPSRLIFAPFEPRHGNRYLPRQRLGDLMLDALHHNAMTTACDALAVGVPVLTLRGSAIASRGGASLISAAGLPELAVEDRETYVAEAIALAQDGGRLGRYREKLLAREGPLFDTAARVRELEECFMRMVERCSRT